MKKSKGSTGLIVLVIVLGFLLIAAVGIAAYFWGKSKNESKTTSSNSNTATTTTQPQIAPKKVVENFMNYSIGTISTATLNFNAARTYLPNDLKEEYNDDASFAARFYGYQEGPTSVSIISENINGNDASVKVNAFWGNMGQGWVFGLLKTNNEWQIIDFRNDAQ